MSPVDTPRPFLKGSGTDLTSRLLPTLVREWDGGPRVGDTGTDGGPRGGAPLGPEGTSVSLGGSPRTPATVGGLTEGDPRQGYTRTPPLAPTTIRPPDLPLYTVTLCHKRRVAGPRFRVNVVREPVAYRHWKQGGRLFLAFLSLGSRVTESRVHDKCVLDWVLKIKIL